MRNVASFIINKLLIIIWEPPAVKVAIYHRITKVIPSFLYYYSKLYRSLKFCTFWRREW